MAAKLPLLVGLLLVFGPVFADPPASVPECRAIDDRVPIKIWIPEFNEKGHLTSKPDAMDGDIVFIEFHRDDADIGCGGAAADKLYSLSYPDPQGADYGGLAVNFRGNVQFANGSCYFSGFFMNEQVAGLHQGWIETYFGPVKKLDVVTSPKFCMAGSAMTRADYAVGSKSELASMPAAQAHKAEPFSMDMLGAAFGPYAACIGEQARKFAVTASAATATEVAVAARSECEPIGALAKERVRAAIIHTNAGLPISDRIPLRTVEEAMAEATTTKAESWAIAEVVKQRARTGKAAR